MKKTGRRNFIRLATKTAATAATLALLPESIRKALAIPAASVAGDIQDVAHIVIFMQENRSFDHYYGTMRGVRGFGDRITIPLPDGRTVWQQRSHFIDSGDILPFHLDTAATRAQCISSLDHGWPSGHQAWNGGKCDSWIDAKTPQTMGYYKEADIPFQFALAGAFTICDAYFCSVMSATDPNRIFLWTGSVNPPGNHAEPIVTNDLAEKNIASWTTCPERLEKAGISWRVYQQGVGDDDKKPFDGNYGDNPLAYFKQYINAPRDSILYREAMSAHTLKDLARDVADETLPQVSWIVAPEAYSEHPAWPPAYGAQYTAQVLDALTSNPKVWSKTVLFINYDENDGYFDHVVSPAPPISLSHGLSTVDARDEIYRDPLLGDQPYGLGVRVPMLIVSPWTRGGWVCSQVFDHTSVLRFIEARFGEPMRETNISAWRRAVCGDLTSAFDFKNPNQTFPALPDTTGYREKTDKECSVLPDPRVPDVGTLPVQEAGTRPARAVPYELHANGRLDAASGKYWIDFVNTGAAAAVFYVYSGDHSAGPRVYTVEAGKELSDSWSAAEYSLSVHGPNGFLRQFKGNAASSASVKARYDAAAGRLYLKLANHAPAACALTVKDNAYGAPARTYEIPAHADLEARWDLTASGRWYDLTVANGRDAQFSQRLAGHLENGHPSTTDPAMATECQPLSASAALSARNHDREGVEGRRISAI